jgi:(p)ppGpp synthase/HD superfamily hydrolase
MPIVTSPEYNAIGPAEAIARELHADQYYYGTGFDFVDYHLTPSVRTIRGLGSDAADEAVFWLHDTVEDTGATLGYLEERGFPQAIVAAVDCLTIRPDESDESNMQRVLVHPGASRLKIVDAERNLIATQELQSTMNPEDYHNCIRKYAGKLILLAGRSFDHNLTLPWSAYIQTRAAFARKALHELYIDEGIAA